MKYITDPAERTFTVPMPASHDMTLRIPLLISLLLTGSADGANPPRPERIEVESGSDFILSGPNDRRQLVVTGHGDGRTFDLTHEATFVVEPTDVARIERGSVIPLKEGAASVRVSASGQTTSVALTVERITDPPTVSFTHQVVPAFTKEGCNTGGCHGKSGGQNGFALSLFGFEPDEDYAHVVLEGRGRRVFPAAPEQSLLLRKAIADLPHGGGKVLRPGSSSYELLLRWIRQGMPPSRDDPVIVARLEMVPSDRVVVPEGSQQLAVLAHFSDGSVRDVTHLAEFEANITDMATVTPAGRVTVANRPGTVAVMARYQSQVAVFQATIPLGLDVVGLPEPANQIDELVFKRWKALGLPPSEIAEDSTFVRRVTIDIVGRLPTPEETEDFVTDGSPDKYARLVDRLLDDPGYADYFANKWAALLRNRRADPKADPKGTFAFHAWIRDSLEKNLPYDQLARSVVTASGEEVKDPPVIWYREVVEASEQVEDIAQLFLGQRIGCAKCHHHPMEKWSQQDYFGMVAFFQRLEIKDPPQPKKKKDEKKAPPKPPFYVKYQPGKDQAQNPRTGQPVPPTPLGSAPLDVTDEEDPRERLADWLADPDNPFFARALANRYWKHFFGIGLIDPEDDMRTTNPASNPELLDALADTFVKSQYDLKAMVRLIATSKVYRLSAVPNEFNAEDRQNFSRFIPKRLPAEVLLDAIDTVTATESKFNGVPSGTRAVQLPDSGFDSYFLSIFGRPAGSSACECERSDAASLPQALHMFNSKEILEKVAGKRTQDLAKDTRSDEEKIQQLYILALAREPSEDELSLLRAHIATKDDPRAAYEDVIWAIINTKEFLYNH